MNFALEAHLRRFFRPRPQPPQRPQFIPKLTPDVPVRTLSQLLTPPRLDIHIQAKDSAASLGPGFYSDVVDNFMKDTLFTENILSVGYEITIEDQVGQHGLDILSDLFGLLNSRLHVFRRIYINVPEGKMKKICSGNLLGLAEVPWRDSTIKLDNAANLREFRWSGNLDLLKDKFQIPFSRLTSLSLLRCRISVDDATLLLAQCHDLRELEIGTIIKTEGESTNACKMPTTWWRHFQLRFTLLESLTIISECCLLEFSSRLALAEPMCGLNLKHLSLTLLTQHASRRIDELYFPWPRLKTVDIEFQLGIIPSENGLHNDLVRKSGLQKSAKLRINESKIGKESQLKPNAAVDDPSGFQDIGEGPMLELDDLDFSNDDGDQVSLLTLPD